MMDIQEEISLIENLKRLDHNDIINNKGFLWEALEVIETSHTQSVFQINDSNLFLFKEFAGWIRNLKEYFPEDKQRLEMVAENMESTFF